MLTPQYNQVYISHIKTTTSKGEVMTTYMISYTSNGQSFREDKKTTLKPKAIASNYKGLGFENIKVRVLS